MSDNNKRRADPPLATLEPAQPTGNPESLRFLRTAIIVIIAILLTWVVATGNREKLDVYKAVAEIEFADPELARCVTETAAAHSWHDIGQFFSLRCNHPAGGGISNLAGLEHFVMLRDLNLAFNSISDVTPIADLPHLAVLELSHNRVGAIPALRFSLSLRRLEINYNRLDSLGWLRDGQYPLLESLAVAHNQISDIEPLREIADLRELTLRGNRVSDVGALAQLTGLEMLDIGANYVSDLSALAGLTQLRRLFVDSNRIASLEPLAGLTSLERLAAGFNPLQTSAGLSALVRLQRLDLRQAGLTDLDNIYLLADIEELEITENPGLDCAAVRRAIAEFGAAAVVTDRDCEEPAPAKPQ